MLGFFPFLFYLLKPKQRSRFKKIIIITIACLAVVGLYLGEDSLFVKELKDKVLDEVMFWHSDGVPVLANNLEMQRMALFEIDEKTFREWGSPLLTPRDKLKALIEVAEKSGASVIAVDLELSWWSDGCIHEQGKTLTCSPSESTADDSLANYLNALNEDENTPLVILTRAYQYPLNDHNFRVRLPSFLDKTLIEEKNVFWSSTFFQVEADGVRRRWQLASLVCQDEHLSVVPSMQLLVALAQLYATDARAAAEVIRTFKKALNKWAKELPCDAKKMTIPHLCQNQSCPDFTIELPTKMGISDEKHIVDLAGGRDTERVVYRFAPSDNPKLSLLSLIDKQSALEVLAEGADVENQIVFIGATHHASGDFHPIPIRSKEVGGVYVVANAVDTLLRFGQFQPQHWIGERLISIFVIIFAIWLVTYYDFVMAFLLSLILGLVLFVWSGQALHHGILVDIGLPLLAIQFVKASISTFESFIEFRQNYFYLKERKNHA